jgi:hypothetical protein
MELFENQELAITEFVVLLESISKRVPKYNTIFKNCYWYTGAICDCVCRNTHIHSNGIEEDQQFVVSPLVRS